MFYHLLSRSKNVEYAQHQPPDNNKELVQSVETLHSTDANLLKNLALSNCDLTKNFNGVKLEELAGNS